MLGCRIFSKKKGFTLIELLIVISIVVVLLASSIYIYGNLQVTSQVDNSTNLIIQNLRIARQRSVSRLNNSIHGIYVEINPSADDRVILFQGASYATRDTAYDYVLEIPSTITLSTTLTDNEIVFTRGTGIPDRTGTITITHSVTGTQVITINSFGLIQ